MNKNRIIRQIRAGVLYAVGICMTLALGLSVIISIPSFAQTTITNTVTVASQTPDPDPTNNEDSTSDPLDEPEEITDLYIEEELTFNSDNTQATIILTAGNNTSISAEDTIVNYSLDDSFTLISVIVDGVELTNPDLTAIDLGTLDPNETNTIEIVVSVTPQSDGSIEYTSIAEISTPDTEITLDNNVDQSQQSIPAPVVDLAIEKSNRGFSLNTNTIEYTITVTNLSDIIADDVAITDTIDYTGAQSYRNFEYSQNPDDESIANDSFELNYDELGPGESITITYEVFIQNPTNANLNNTSQVSTETNEIVLDNNTDQTDTQVITIVNVTVTTPRTGALAILGIASLVLVVSISSASYYLIKKNKISVTQN